jgi:two-component system, sensor histidine kinase and response regulator
MTNLEQLQYKLPIILIVDDNPHNLQILGKILRENRFEIEFATNGKAALDWITIKKFDLILLDINMPEMDGFQLCINIRSNPLMIHVPIIFLSAETDRESILKGFELGAQDYITKPFDSRELLVRIKTHLDLKSTLEKLEIEKENAQSADRLKSTFLATMSHELRTPLNSIIGFTGILLKEAPGPLNDEQKKQLGMVQNSARHLLSLINDILDISKIEAGQLKMNIQKFNLREVLNKVVEINKQFADKKNLPILVTIDNNINEIISDSLRVQQILVNFVNNAIKFTETGTISINCTLTGNSVEIKISDTGIGIENENLKQLFKPFIQIETGMMRLKEGTGLGLSICKKLSEMLGGEIKVDSIFGTGSTFSLYLPINKILVNESKIS